MHNGSCLCGKITFVVKGELPAPVACHCTSCRKHTGHYEASADVSRDDLVISGEEFLTWYTQTKVRRGFCSVCGASLFFDPLDKEKNKWIGVSMGAFDGPTGTKLAQHIFVSEKGDYYELCDGLPQNET